MYHRSLFGFGVKGYIPLYTYGKTDQDRKFLVSFEKGKPSWDSYEFTYLEKYPSVQWKMLNLKKLAKTNPNKVEQESEKLNKILIVDYNQNIKNLSQQITTDLKERVVNPGMRHFSEDTKQKIKELSSITSSTKEIINKIIKIISDDNEVKHKPDKWFIDAIKELNKIVEGQDKPLNAYKGMQR